MESKLTPTRDDGFERCVAVEETVRILVGRSPSRKACQDLAAILYGTNDVADVTPPARSVTYRPANSKLPKVQNQTKNRTRSCRRASVYSR